MTPLARNISGYSVSKSWPVQTMADSTSHFSAPASTVRRSMDFTGHVEAELHAKSLGQEPREVREGPARVHRDFRGAPNGAEQAIGPDGLGSRENVRSIQPIARVTELGSHFAELLRDGGFVRAVDHVQRASREVGESRGGQNFDPQIAAAQRHRVHAAGGLADGSDHADVADGGTRGLWAALEDHHRASAPGQGIGVRETQNTRSDDGDIRGLRGHERRGYRI